MCTFERGSGKAFIVSVPRNVKVNGECPFGGSPFERRRRAQRGSFDWTGKNEGRTE